MKKLRCIFFSWIVTGIPLVIFITTSVAVFAQQDSIMPGVYLWKEPREKNSSGILSTILFQGSTYDMEWLQMSAKTIPLSKTKHTATAPTKEEQILIIKSGKLTIGRDSTYSLTPGGVAIFMPGESYTLQNSGEQPCSYYLMSYRSRTPADVQRAMNAGWSNIKEWSKIEYKPHDRGGRRDFFDKPTVMCKRFEMHVTTLKPGLKSHDPHRHHAAEMILLIDGDTEMQIGDKMYRSEKGGIYYLPSYVLHGIRNTGVKDCSYFAFQFE